MKNVKWITDKFLHIAYLTGREWSGIINKRENQSGEKNILLFCQSQTMEEHLLNYMEQLEENKRYLFYLRFGEGYADGKRHKIKDTLFDGKDVIALESTCQMYTMKWALIVCPDMDYPFWIKRGTIPVIYIGHGSGGISYDGGEHSYDYSNASLDEKGRPLFDIMLEPNKETAKLMEKDSIYGKIIRSAGYRFAYKFRDAAMDKEAYQYRLGIPSGRKVVSIWGSWNRDSLFHVLGTELFEVCKKLKEEGYEFIFSIHPREYSRYAEDVEPLGKMVEQQRESGFFVRSPGEDWLPYMMASDMIVVDYSAMLSLAVLAGKKVVLSDFPDGRIWKKSMYYEIKKKFPVIAKAKELPDALEKIEHTDKYDKEIARFQEQLYVSKGDYKKFIQSVTSELVNRSQNQEKKV
ncbi:MAG: CDP-glycerol glycerophosphotransferase family protein [Clostridiales bacterium]|nr:CDP-glycerol glycerophosphotransferase family protein [Clostridiales bacterium]